MVKEGEEKTIPELTDRLIEIIKMTRQREIPDKPPACVPQRKVMPVLGQLISAVIVIDQKRKEDTDEFELNCRVKGWHLETGCVVEDIF